MIPGSVCLETSDQHKIVNAMTVDHRSMWRRTQILIYILSHQWTWVTSRNATHRTPRSPSLSKDGSAAFFHPLSLRTFPPSARQSALLALQAQNANLICKLRTIASPISFFALYNWLERNEVGFQGAEILPSLGSCSFKSLNLHMYILYVDGTDANFHQNFLTSDAEVQTVDTLHRTRLQSLIHHRFSLILQCIWLWRKMRKGWLFFF